MRKVIAQAGDDTSTVIAMKSIGYDFYAREQYDSADRYVFAALDLCDKLGYTRGKCGCFEMLGLVAFDRGKYSEALQNFLQSYQLATELNYLKGISHSTTDLGLVYFYTGDYPTALRYYLESLKIKEAQHDSLALETVYNNIVGVLKEENNLEDAKSYLLKKIGIGKRLHDSIDIGYAYLSLGELYLRLGQRNIKKLDTATYYENLAEQIGLLTNNKLLSASAYSYLGDILMQKNDCEAALVSYKKSLDIVSLVDDKEITSMVCLNIGKADSKLRDYAAAGIYYDKALEIARKMNDKRKLMLVYGALTSYDSLSGHSDSVLEHYEKYILYRDSIYSERNARKIENEKLTYENEKQRSAMKEEADRKLQRQKILRDLFIGGFGLALVFSVVFFRQRVRITHEKKRSDDLLLNILPAETADELKEKGKTAARSYDKVTVLFTDFKNFTKTSENLSPQELVNEINECYSEFDRIVSSFGVEKIKTIGDGYMAAGGLPVKNDTNPVDVVNAALAIRDFIELEKKRRMSEGKPYFEVRIGVHTGHVIAGVVGIKKFAYDIWGDTVNIASRMESSGEPGKVNISGATFESVKDIFLCTYRGKVLAKNKGEVDMYFVERKTT